MKAQGRAQKGSSQRPKVELPASTLTDPRGPPAEIPEIRNCLVLTPHHQFLPCPLEAGILKTWVWPSPLNTVLFSQDWELLAAFSAPSDILALDQPHLGPRPQTLPRQPVTNTSSPGAIAAALENMCAHLLKCKRKQAINTCSGLSLLGGAGLGASVNASFNPLNNFIL